MAAKRSGKPAAARPSTGGAGRHAGGFSRQRAAGLLAAIGTRSGIALTDPSADLRTEVMPSGIDSLDVATCAGGYPVGRLTILHGMESCGKTTAALVACAEAQSRGGVAVFIDAEHKLDLAYAAALGVDVPSLVLMRPDSIEKCFKQLTKVLHVLRGKTMKKPKKGRFDRGDPEDDDDDDDESGPVNAKAMDELAGFDFPIVIILDSFQSLVAQRAFDAEFDASSFNPESGAWAQGLRKFIPYLDELRGIMLGISQVRVDLAAAGWGKPKEKVGVGKAPVHHATLVVKWTSRRKTGATKKGITGEIHEVVIVKNQIGTPYRTASIPIRFGEGVDKTAATMTAAQATKVLVKSGAFYTVDIAGYETARIRTSADFDELVAADPDFLPALRTEIRQRMGAADLVATVNPESVQPLESLD